jgi:uncharacterized protein YneF (UPF0154 family)
MGACEEIRRLESELELNKQNLHEDAAQIRHKIDETKAELSPTNLVRRRVYLILGLAFSVGFIAGYFLEWRRIRPEQVARPVLEHIGKPAARTMASTAGKQLITSAIRE